MKRLFFMLLALLCLLLLFVGGPGPYASRSLKYGWDLGHVFCFALWTWLYLQGQRPSGLWFQLLKVLGLTLLIGGSIELLQAAVGREGSWYDLYKDLIGGMLALFFFAPGRRQWVPEILRTFQLLTLAVLLWSALPIMKVSIDEVIAWQQFPLLSGFETPWEADRWGGNSRKQKTTDRVHAGEAALKIELNTDRYSGTFLRHFPNDWSGYAQLRLQVFNPDPEPLTVYFRIHDQLHRLSHNAYSDRFHTTLTLNPGWTQLDIPLATVAAAPKERHMEMTRIAGMGLFVDKLERPRTIYIDSVELTKEGTTENR
jgi:VanZ family protein